MKNLFLTLILVAPLVGFGQTFIRDRETGDIARVINGALQTSATISGNVTVTASTNQNISSVGGSAVVQTNGIQTVWNLNSATSSSSAGISNAITSFEIPITAVAYTAGQVAGGLCYWTNTGIADKSVTLSQVWFIDRDNQKPNITLIPFSTHPAARAGDVAAYTNAQLPTMLGDMLYSVAPIRILSSDWTTVNDAGNSKAFVSVSNLGRDFVAQSNNVPFLVILDSAATYTQTTNLVISASFQK